MLIREETPSDFKEIYRLVKTAFKTAKVFDGTEQDYVDTLRASGNYIPELGLVTVEHNNIIGHILLTRHDIGAAEGKTKPRALLLAPLSVLLEHRSKGVGAALMHEAIRRAGQMKYEAIVLAGDPAYYSRFGFKSIIEYGATSRGPIPVANVLALELKQGALSGCTVELVP